MCVFSRTHLRNDLRSNEGRFTCHFFSSPFTTHSTGIHLILSSKWWEILGKGVMNIKDVSKDLIISEYCVHRCGSYFSSRLTSARVSHGWFYSRSNKTRRFPVTVWIYMSIFKCHYHTNKIKKSPYIIYVDFLQFIIFSGEMLSNETKHWTFGEHRPITPFKLSVMLNKSFNRNTSTANNKREAGGNIVHFLPSKCFICVLQWHWLFKPLFSVALAISGGALEL